ncbi:MAG: hypothetical protein AB1705_12385 [Verrucomicrobiota bacterium]
MKAEHKLVWVTVLLTSLVWSVVPAGIAARRAAQERATIHFIEDERFEFDGILPHDRVTPWRLPIQPGSDSPMPPADELTQ